MEQLSVSSTTPTQTHCRIVYSLLRQSTLLIFLSNFGVCALFGDNVPLDINERNEIINSWPDEGVQAESIEVLFEEVDDKLSELFDALGNKLDIFLTESGLLT